MGGRPTGGDLFCARDRDRVHLFPCLSYTGMYIAYEGGHSMQQTKPDAAPTCGKPKEDVDDLIFRADSGRTVSER